MRHGCATPLDGSSSSVAEQQRVRIDYKPRWRLSDGPVERREHHWRLRWAALGVGMVALSVVMAKNTEPGAITTSATQQDAATFQQITLDLPAPSLIDTVPAPDQVAADDLTWRTLTVRSGDSLARLLAREDIGTATVHALTATGEEGRQLARLFPGDEIRLGFDDDNELRRLVREHSPERHIEFERSDNGFEGRTVEVELERRLEYGQGRIERSLSEAGGHAGLSPRMTHQLATIFGWDIDFALDLRRGDEFRLVYEVFHKNGQKVRDGDIVAAEFINDGRRYRALRYTDPDGDTDYYAPDGSSMRRAFLRAPLEYARITSSFGPRRHPILHTMRNHNGVDYAAATGTPIRATGDGRITWRGGRGGYGHTIVIQHGERYSTLYAHMSRYRSGQGVGTRVRQGDIIGYVGQSGLATGPHLHYEFLIDGRHRDPQRVELPSGDPVAREYRAHFHDAIDPLVAQLDALERVYAMRDPR